MDKQRAVFYCRVSTDDDNQATSIVNQKAESINTIEENGWMLVDQYIDEGKSGTTTVKRNEYNRLFKDMERDKFDIIVIKSQDRLMRSTKEWYFFIDRLVQNDKKLYFYLERKFYSPDDSLITGIKAILAEDYSRSLSKNINNAHRKRQEFGTNVLITSKTWGYDKVKKEVVINEKEAEMIRFIFEMALQNYGSRTIAKMLQDKGYKNRNGDKIAEQTVRGIIRNPLYKGTAIMNKYHKNFETKKTERNSEDMWIYHDNIVPAIVDDNTWSKANVLMDNRSKMVITDDFKEKIIGSKKNLTMLSGKIICGLCNKSYWIRTSQMAHGLTHYLSCSEYVSRGRKTINSRSISVEKKYSVKGTGCDNIHIKESDLDNLLYDVASYIYGKSSDDITENAIAILRRILDDGSNIKEQESSLLNSIDKITSNREFLLDKFIDGKISDDIYNIKEKKLQCDLEEAKRKLEEIKKKKTSNKNQSERFEMLKKEIKEISDHNLAIRNIKSHIETITVFPNKLDISFDMFPNMTINIERINYKNTKYTIA